MGKKKKHLKENIVNETAPIYEVTEEEVTTNDVDIEDNNEVEDKNFVEEKIEEKKDEISYDVRVKKKNPFILNCLLIILLLTSLGYLVFKLSIGVGDDAIISMVDSFILLLFTSIFVCLGFSVGKRKKSLFILSSLLLIGYFGFSLTTDYLMNSSDKILNFSGMSLTDVIEWTEDNKIELIQDYEYSDMIDEYHIISQDVLPGTKVKDVDKLTVAISEGPNPAKEISVPSMVGWESEKVLEFILNNHLSNVKVEWIESEDKEDTVIVQSKVGNLKRNEEIKLTFSAGEVISTNDVKLIDFTGKSEFEVIFYLKQHHVNYEIKRDFSKDVKVGYTIGQSIKAGTSIKVKDTKLVITISKGPEIKIIDLKGMSVTEVTDWIIKNKLKIEFDDAYDDSINENHVIKANYKAGDVVEEGTVIKVVLSKGKLIMPMFSDINEFRTWAQKYSINYTEEHAFSNEIGAGKIIKFSHNDGSTIKNGDTVVVTISDGEKISVPNVVGVSKESATSKLKAAGLGYNFVYSYNNSVAKGTSFKQSISAGSGVAKGTTVTVTVSNGPKPAAPAAPVCDKSKGAVINIQGGSSGSQTQSMIKALNPNHKFSFNMVSACPNGDSNPGAICSGNIDGVWKNYCDTITITIVK